MSRSAVTAAPSTSTRRASRTARRSTRRPTRSATRANKAITDPYGTGWWTNTQGEENGDLCAWWFGSPVGTTLGGQPYNQVINGHDYSLQQEFSNAANAGGGGCLEHLGGTASAVSPYAGDVGPLAYHNGSLMRTATVYTIYWIPAPTPAISTSPVVTGNTVVGQTLSTTDGTWANLPTSYSYKWQRCNNASASCVTIAGATSSTYKLVSGDAGHTIRSLVQAENANGQAADGYTPSAATGVVVGVPKLLTAPKISGATKVGGTVSVGTGKWTYSPTQFAYQWLRCTSSGTKCGAIAGRDERGVQAHERRRRPQAQDQGHGNERCGLGATKSPATAVVPK